MRYIVIASCCLLVVACSRPPEKAETPQQHVEVNAPAAKTTKSAPAARQVTVRFTKDKVIEVAYISIKPGMEKQVFGDYFPKAMPIAAKYGARPLAMMHVSKVVSGQDAPKMVGFFEWPSVAKFVELNEDKDFQAIVPIRDEALSFLSPGHFFTVAEDTEVTFHEDRMYGLWSAWIRPEGGELVGQYVNAIGPTADKLGRRNLLSLSPAKMSKSMHKHVEAACSRDGAPQDPGAVGLIEWPNTDAFEQFVESAAFKKAQPLKEKALSRFDLLHAKFAFPEG